MAEAHARAAAAFDAFGDTTTTTFWEFDENGHLVSKVEDTDRSFVVHDYAITDEHYVLPISPIEVVPGISSNSSLKKWMNSRFSGRSLEKMVF